MSSNEETISTETPTRRKIIWGLGVLSMFAAVAAATRFPFITKKNVISCKPESKKRTIKMLTQDGTLVEVDESLLTASRKKISNDELRDWIKK